ncbi:hypothetical protein KFK09_022726 [Dendrobium nobile]|uniref:BED-type domain-containing protein n=1 Tax=Dendrobium nobile TaxID=94219 RepID=A0A8T3AJY0_DENNO|nr:hypothetical protein KFK09_022726 [Dendrobium nobile]
MEASGTQSLASSISVREKVDIVWNHFSEIKDAEGKRQFKCLHCSIVYKGGGINRMKQHLAGVKRNIAACKKVPHDIRFQMQKNMKDISKRKQQVQEELESTPFPIDAEVDERGDTSSLPKFQSSEAYLSELAKGKRKLAEIDTFFAPRTKSAVHRADLDVARWFFDCCIPFNALNLPYAQKAVDAITVIGLGYKLPSYHNMRVNLLKDCKEECRLLIDCYRNTCKDTRCTLMANGWTDGRSRTLINFMIYCPRGISFLKSVDASDIVKDATNLCTLFSEVVELVGPENIVQLVTDNAANYKKADLGSMPLIEDLAKKASKVTIFAYNHVYFYADSKIAKTCKGKEAAEIILDLKFWNDCLTISKIVGPLIRLLRIVDSDEKPSLGYLYDGMYRARKAIKAMFKNVKRLYKPFTNICQKPEVLQGLVELLGNKDVCHKPKLAMNEVRLFRDSLESFGKSIALTMAKEMQPDEWWKMFVSSVPNLFQLKKRSYDPLDYTCVEMVDFWVLDEESPPDLALEELETKIYEEASMPVVEEANIASTQPTPGELENEGDGADIIDFNDLGAFVAADFDEAGHEDLNNEDSFHDAN